MGGRECAGDELRMGKRKTSSSTLAFLSRPQDKWSVELSDEVN